jgi:8-oxo-dGTP pyrophosphatase MutT (NUDIX family)
VLLRATLPRYVLGALGLVWDDQGRLLLVRQSYRTPGWALPGGGVRAGETLEACLLREMAEELGWEVEIGPVVGFIGGTHRLLPIGVGDVGFVCYWRAGVFQPSDEITEIRYLPMDQAALMVSPGIRPLIDLAATQLHQKFS